MYSLIAFRTGIEGGPVPALSKYALREVTGICFLTRSMFKRTPLKLEPSSERLSIKEALLIGLAYP